MNIRAIKTKPVEPGDDLQNIIFSSLVSIEEKSVIIVTSKIVALCEGRVADPQTVDRDQLVPQESEYYLPRELNKYGFCLSINNNTLIASAGIDQSNANGLYVLWPKDPQKSANLIRDFLVAHYGVKHIGVILTDSHVLPLRWGTQGTAIAYSGFKSLNNYIGKPDIYGYPLKVTKANICEGLAAAAVVCMGEGDEQTPIAIVEDIPFVEFQDRNPTTQEIEALKISLEDDVFAPILTSAPWKKGGKKKQ